MRGSILFSFERGKQEVGNARIGHLQSLSQCLGHPKPVDATEGVAKGTEEAERYVIGRTGWSDIGRVGARKARWKSLRLLGNVQEGVDVIPAETQRSAAAYEKGATHQSCVRTRTSLHVHEKTSFALSGQFRWMNPHTL